MQRVVILVLDSFGVGSTKDADRFGDYGANTLGNIAKACKLGKANYKRNGLLKIPNLIKLGLAKIAEQSIGSCVEGLDSKDNNIIGAYAYAKEMSLGKDTPSGHWEIAGVPVLNNWHYFLKKENSFPKIFLEKLLLETKLPGFLGNCHASGINIINKFGVEHMNTGKPIFYTSNDSVFQVACHEKTFGLNNLYKICKIIRSMLTNENYHVCRVIARPFIGKKYNFVRTNNRRDLTLNPPGVTVLQKLIEEKKGTVVSIGKISDIFSKKGISKHINAIGLKTTFEATIKEINIAKDNTLIFVNFVDFDSYYGHRRDVSGYARALELFDTKLPKLMSKLKNDDIMIITADHGCDPTWHGTDHTRENIPILIYGSNITPGFYGYRQTFADIGQTIAHYFNLSPMKYGKSIF